MSHFFLRIHAETQFFQLPIPKSLRCWGNELAKASAASSHTGWKRCFATQKLEFHDLRNLVNAQDTRKAYRSLETSCLISFWSIPRPQPSVGHAFVVEDQPMSVEQCPALDSVFNCRLFALNLIVSWGCVMIIWFLCTPHDFSQIDQQWQKESPVLF